MPYSTRSRNRSSTQPTPPPSTRSTRSLRNITSPLSYADPEDTEPEFPVSDGGTISSETEFEDSQTKPSVATIPTPVSPASRASPLSLPIKRSAPLDNLTPPPKLLNSLSSPEPHSSDTNVFDNSQEPPISSTSESESESEIEISSGDENELSFLPDSPSPVSTRRTVAKRKVTRLKGRPRVSKPSPRVLRNRELIKKPKTINSTVWPLQSKTNQKAIKVKQSKMIDSSDSEGDGYVSSSPDASESKNVAEIDLQPIKFDCHDWSLVGGLSGVLRSLKEIAVLPMLYPDLFTQFGVSPPSGVLLVGPPGCGKTLVARVVASMSGLSFFVRKGSDILSKYVGEAERQLRLLFEAAKKHSPSIIFFDEIDGLTPPRNSRNDNHYSSVVSTLLALMDGIEFRGRVLVMGATNRPDNIDPALRRPGRFDRELVFDLPGEEGRLDILRIFTSKWKHTISNDLLVELARKTVGYSGADLKGLCSEAVVNCIRRSFPEAYVSDVRLELPASRCLAVTELDFEYSFKRIVSTRDRGSINLSKNFNVFDCLFAKDLAMITSKLSVDLLRPRGVPMGVEGRPPGGSGLYVEASKVVLTSEAQQWFGLVPPVPSLQYFGIEKVLIHGSSDYGQSILLSNLIAQVNSTSVFDLSLSEIFNSSFNSSESILSSIISRIKTATSTCVVMISDIVLWWNSVNSTCQGLLSDLLIKSQSFSCQILFIATSFIRHDDVEEEISTLFSVNSILHEVSQPLGSCLNEFFSSIIKDEIFKVGDYEEIRIPLPEQSKTTTKFDLQSNTKINQIDSQLKSLESDQLKISRRLRLDFREILRYLMSRYTLFVSIEDSVPNYPKDLLTFLSLVDSKRYFSVEIFKNDFYSMIEILKSRDISLYFDLSYNDILVIHSRLNDMIDVFEERLVFIPSKIIKKSEKINSKINSLLVEKESLLIGFENSMISSLDFDCCTVKNQMEMMDVCLGNLNTIQTLKKTLSDSVVQALYSLVPQLVFRVTDSTFAAIEAARRGLVGLIGGLGGKSEAECLSIISKFRQCD
ncbi:hypothetical protein RCL1_005635 [Eukaryota sp. TZLM3-RCL]